MTSFGSNLRRWTIGNELISFRSLVLVSPVFLLTVKHWTNVVVLLVSAGSLIFLFRNKVVSVHDTDVVKRWRWIITLILVGPLLSVGMGQMLRGEFYPPNYDSPLRIALCAPIFLATSYGWFFSKSKGPISFLWMRYCYPLTLIWTFIYTPSWTKVWGEQVITTYFVDPLSFGTLTLLFSLLSFAFLSFYWPLMKWSNRILSLFGILIGIYLSVKSGSRTGWINLPIFLIIWAITISIPRYGKFRSFLTIVILCSFIFILVLSNPYFIKKIMNGYFEIVSYKWDHKSIEGSADIRISFYRMAIFYISQSPLEGWGDLGWLKISDSIEISKFSSEYARHFPINGFHNEILTSGVRSGLFGLLTSISLFLFPIIWSIRTYNLHPQNNQKMLGLSILFYSIHMLVAGMTTEVTNLVFLASFLGLTYSIFLGESLHNYKA